MSTCLLVMVLPLIVVSRPVCAQWTQARGRLELFVRNSVDSSALKFAGVILDRRTELRADSSGELVLHALPVGRHELLVRVPGFVPETLAAEVLPDAHGDLTAWLRPIPRQLARIVTAAPTMSVMDPTRSAAERARINNGAFFSAALIDSLNPLRTKDLLAGLAGVQVNDRGITFSGCQQGATMPGPSGSKAGAPKVQVYVDGMRLTSNDDSERGVNEALASVNPRSIRAMEVYTHVARIPAEYLSDACAVIVIWTK